MIKKIFQGLKFLPIRELNHSTDKALADIDLITKGGGERQAAKTLDGIRPDHVGRYEFATQYVPDKGQVLDMACGVGYGAYILASQTNCQNILAIDISRDGIKYANQHYRSPKITYRQADCLTTNLKPDNFDVVVSFETVEHIQNDKLLIKRFFAALKPDGKLILSTPNQLLMPFISEKFPFHIRHYTPEELIALITSVGFSVESCFSQPNKRSTELIPGWEGLFNIVVCSKPSNKSIPA